MKALHVIPSVSERSGGPGHAIISMCRSLQAQGTVVRIATTNADLSEQVVLAEPEVYKGVPAIFFSARWGQSFKYSRPMANWLDRNVKDFDVVHIHAIFNHACIAGARACRKHRVPYVVRPLGSLDPWSMKQKPLRKSLFWWLAGRRMLRGAAAVHYTAAAEKQAAEDSLGLNHGKVIPLGVDLQLPIWEEKNERCLLQNYDLAKHSYVLVMSRLHPKKGLEVLLKAFLSLIEQNEFKEWRLVLAGEGPDDYVGALKRTVSTRRAEGVVIFPGWLEGEEKNEFLRHASLLALPSHHENFGLCVMEALACGVPVLVSPHVNLASEIESAGAGWIAPVDVDAIQAALAAAMRDGAERKRRGDAGRLLSQKFSCESVASQLNQMYAEVSAESSR